MEVLYIIARTDLQSMTPGKVAAQVAHAASQAAVLLINSKNSSYCNWCNDPLNERNPTSKYPQDAFSGFGTTIVLDGGDGDDLERLKIQLDACDAAGLNGMIVDPSFPLWDGKQTHYIELLTCLWCFTSTTNSSTQNLMSKFSLYSGNVID